MNEEVLDWKEGMSRVLNKRELYVRLLGKFMNAEKDSAAKIEQALRDGDLDAARQLVHSTKGVAANLGARALAAVALDLETALKAGAGTEDCLGRFKSVHTDTLASVQAFIDQ